MIPARTEGPVLVEHGDDGVLVLTFHRPERANTLTREMERDYRGLLGDAARDADVRAVVVTGTGRAFCAGADLDQLLTLAGDSAANAFDTPSFRAPTEFPKPLIAAVNGACAGVGLLQALYADVRFVAEEARMTTAFARLGIVAEQGMTDLLCRIVGEANARDLLLSGRTIDGVEAAAMGLASRALPRDELLGAARAYAREIAEQCAPSSLAAIKEGFAELVREGYHDAADRSGPPLRAALDGPDFAEGIAAMRAKRRPEYPGLAARAPEHLAWE